MRIRAIVFTLLIAVTTAFGAADCAVIGQNGWFPRYIPEECYPARTFGFAALVGPERLKEIVRILKTSLGLVNVDADATASTVTVRGSEERLALTDWLLRELDQPAAKGASHMDRYSVSTALQKELSPNANDEVIGVFFLAHTDNLGIQELFANLVVVGDVRTPANDVTGKKIVVRGSQAQLAMAKHIIDALDVEPETATSVPDFTVGNEVVRLFFRGQVKASPSNSQILAALRNVVEIQHSFVFSKPAAIAVRGSADEIAAADWLIRSLELKPSAGAREFRFAGTDREDNVMRVFYQPHAKVDTLKSLAFDSPAALLVRGSASQVAAAEQLMQ
jgi:hypothetical protein